MRKYLLMAGAALIGLGGSAYAAIDCAVPPTCDELGYVMNPDECLTDDVLTCPFDDGKVFCFRKGRPLPATNCELGSVLYSDMQCYDAHPGGDVTPVGVVFDASRRLAINSGTYPFKTWSYSDGDIAGLDSCTGTNYNFCEIDGKSNTQKIVAQVGNGSSSYPAGYCYNLTTGDMPQGSWFLPSASELKTLWNNKDAVNTTLKTLGGKTIEATGSVEYYWSSNEYDDSYALNLNLETGNVTSNGKDSPSALLSKYHSARCAIAY